MHPAAETPVDLDQNVQVTDLGQYTNFAKVVLASEEYKLAVKGRTGLHQKGLRAITVGYDKVVTLKGTLPSAKTHNGCGSLALIACHSIVGLNGLKGFNVTSFQILLTASPDGANMIGKVYIPNPSVMTMEMVRPPFPLPLPLPLDSPAKPPLPLTTNARLPPNRET